jgi:hypothetical protein
VGGTLLNLWELVSRVIIPAGQGVLRTPHQPTKTNQPTNVMAHDIVPRCVATSFHVSGPAVRLVVPRRVQGELPDQLAVLGDHSDLQAVDQHENARADQPATEPDVVQP